jgi:hypothetical protein
MTTSRFFHTATLLDSGLVLVAGGDGPPSTPALKTAELYDPVEGTWTATGELAAAHGPHTATLLRSGSVLVAGGASIGGFISIPNSESFDPAQGRWSDAGCLRPPSFFQTATLLSSGAVLVTGGVGDSNRSLTSAKLYGVVTISPSRVAVAPKALQPFTARGGGESAFTWLLTRNASGGTLAPDGQYTAGELEGVEDVITVSNAAGQSASAHITVGAQLVSAAATRGVSASGCSTVGENGPFSLIALLSLVVLGRLTLTGRRTVRARRARRGLQATP